MTRYVLKRLLLVVPTLILVSLFVFGIVRAIPGDVVDMMLEQFQYGKDAEELRARLGLDRPHRRAVPRPGRAASSVATSAQSLWTNRPAAQDIAARFPVTITLSLLSIAISLLVALPVGILAAVRQDSGGRLRGPLLRGGRPVGAQLLARDPHRRAPVLLLQLGAVHRQLHGPSASAPDAYLEQFILPGHLPRRHAGRHHHAHDPGDDARGPAPGLRAHGAAPRAWRGRGGARPRAPQRDDSHRHRHRRPDAVLLRRLHHHGAHLRPARAWAASCSRPSAAATTR